MIDSYAFFIIWLAFTVLTVCAITPFFIWAIRSGQFSKFDRAGRLPLRSMIVEKKSVDKDAQPSDDRRGANVQA